MNNLHLGYNQILDLGQTIARKITEFNVNVPTRLTISLSDSDFRKVDEELYYRGTNKETEYIPANNEVIVNFGSCKIVFEKENIQSKA